MTSQRLAAIRLSRNLTAANVNDITQLDARVAGLLAIRGGRVRPWWKPAALQAQGIVRLLARRRTRMVVAWARHGGSWNARSLGYVGIVA